MRLTGRYNPMFVVGYFFTRMKTNENVVIVDR